MDKFNETDETDIFDGFDDDGDDDDLRIVVMEDEDGNKEEFFIIDAASHKGSDYLLVAPADSYDSDDTEASIVRLKFNDSPDDTYSVYEFVEDDNEFNEVSTLFASLDGDYEIKL